MINLDVWETTSWKPSSNGRDSCGPLFYEIFGRKDFALLPLLPLWTLQPLNRHPIIFFPLIQSNSF